MRKRRYRFNGIPYKPQPEVQTKLNNLNRKTEDFFINKGLPFTKSFGHIGYKPKEMSADDLKALRRVQKGK